MRKIRCLSGNTLKLIAAIAMVVDHVGLLFFPNKMIFRAIGRLSFPLFAFMIAEGCRHTRSKVRYLLTMASLATVFQLVYFFALGETNMCIFVTFTLSIIMVYSLHNFKRALFVPKEGRAHRLLSLLWLMLVFFGVFVLDLFFEIDYDFAGCMIPVMASIPHCDEDMPEEIKRFDTHFASVITTTLGLLVLAMANKPIQYFSLLTVPLLLLYSGKRGKLKLKYFFYIFYPAHLVLLYGLDLLLKYLK